MEIVRLKSAQNPFEIVWPRGVSFDTYNFEPSYSTFEWWNHWPVAQLVSSGRLTVTSDRASHSSLSHIYWDPYENTADTMIKLLLCGLIARDGAESSLPPLAKSWIAPPDAKLADEASGKVDYDPAQRAYLVTRTGGGQSQQKPLSIRFAATPEHPLVNPAIVIAGWNPSAKASVSVDGKKTNLPVRFGIEHHLDGDTAVVYIEMKSSSPIEIAIAPFSATR